MANDNDIYSQLGISPNDYAYDPVNDTIVLKEQALPSSFNERFQTPANTPIPGVTGVPIPVDVQARADAFEQSKLPWTQQKLPVESSGYKPLDKLMGLGGEERYQLWPEKMIRSGLTLAGDVASGKLPVETESKGEKVTIEPYGIWQAFGAKPYLADKVPEVIVRAQDMAGLAGMSTIGIKPGTASVGSGAVRTIYRGEYTGNKGGKFWSNDPEFAQQFTQTGQRHEVKSRTIAEKDIYKPEESIYAGDVDKVDKALLEAKKGGFKAIELNEGANQPNSILFLEDTKAATGIAGLNSSLQNTIANAKVGKATPEQWQQYLKNQPGIKLEELEFSLQGLPQGVITKEQLLAHARDNGVKLQEVWKGKNIPGEYLTPESNRWDPNNISVKTSDTKYSSYQLPGGENYRELLLTVPNKEQRQMGWEWFDPATQKSRAYKTEAEAKANAPEGAIVTTTEIGPPSNPAYKSSHWDEPNPLVHIRMNDRDIPGVGKTLHIEEIQSDWHQEGRKRGYREENPPLTQEQRKVLDRERTRLSNEIYELESQNGYERFRDQIDAKQKRIDEIGASFGRYKNEDGVPQAPFKKTWDELALKKVLTQAVNDGYDAVSWTPGEAQAARYDLSKQIEMIHFTKTDKGYLLAPTSRSNGHEVPVNNGLPIPAEKLQDFVGKEIAEKIIKRADEKPNETHTLENVDLKIGGEGMKGFYDTILLAKANALIKKMGGKVEYQEVPIAKKWEGGISGEMVMDDLGIPQSQHREYWRNLNQSERDKLFEQYQDKHSEKENIKVPIIKITPQMRETIAQKGFPLYSAGVPVFTPVPEDPFKKKEPKLVPVDFNPFAIAP